MSHVLDITIDHTKVAGDLTDYIVLVVPTNHADWAALYAIATEGGGDLRFFKAGGATELAREIVSFSASAETGEIHVKYTGTTSSTVDTVIEVHADGTSGDYGVTATYGRNAVWSAYRTVWHMDNTTNAVGNSSYNLNNFNSVTFGAGKVGKAADTGASNTNKSLYVGTSEVLNSSEHQSNFTHSFWLNFRSVPTATATLARSYADVGASKRMIQFQYDPSGSNGVGFFWVGSTLNWYHSGDFLSASTWYKIDYVLGTSGALSILLNDVLILSTTVTNFNTRGDNEGLNNNWGYFLDRSNAGGSFNPWSGYVDEARVRTSAASTSWLTTEYNNQSSPATFYSVTPVSTGPTYTLTADTASFTVTANSASLLRSLRLTASSATFTVTPVAAALLFVHRLTATPASFVVTSSDAVLTVTRRLSGTTASYAITGQPAQLVAQRRLTAATATFTVTPQDAQIARMLVLSASPASFTVSASDASLRVSRLLTAETASYVISTEPVDFTITYRLNGQTASFAVTPTDTPLLYHRRMVAETGAFAITPQAALLLRRFQLIAATATFTVTPSTASLLFNRRITASPASYVITPSEAGIRAQRWLQAQAGSYGVTGNDASLRFDRVIQAVSAEYIISPYAAQFTVLRGAISDPYCPRPKVHTRMTSPYSERERTAQRPPKDC